MSDNFEIKEINQINSLNNETLLISEIYNCKKISELNTVFTNFLNLNCGIIESELILTENLSTVDSINLNEDQKSELQKRILYLIEEGIVDWALQSNEPQLIMDLQSQLKGNLLNILMVPIPYKNNNIGIYISFTENGKDFFDSNLISKIKTSSLIIGSGLYTMILNNKYESLESKYYEINDRFLGLLPLTSFGEISLTVLKEVSLPLQIIDSNISLIESGVGNLSRRLEIIKQQIKSISEIINLLDEVSIDAKNSEPEIIDVDDMINETLNILTSQLKSAGISITINAGDDKLLILGVKTQLEFIIIQIINFIMLNPNETEHIYINFNKQNSRTILIAIRDETKGLEYDSFDSLIELLKSNSSMNNISQNFMSMKHILKIHKARIESSAFGNNGTIFRLFFPIHNLS